MFKERIREYYDALTPGFRKLADFIMQNTLDAAFLTASELARRVSVDPATVVRFSQEIGYSGYRELSREIKRYVRDQVTSTYREAKEAKTEEDVLKVILDNTEQQLQHFRTTETATLAKATEILKSSTRLWITGEFTSHDLAAYLSKSLCPAIGIESTYFHPSISETAAAVAQMEEGEVLLALALGIPGLDTGYAVRLAREKGLKTVCITNSGTILPAREADVTVIVPTKSPLTSASFNISLLLIGTLWEAIVASHVEESAEAFTAVHSHMAEILDLRGQTEEYEIPTNEA
ncbi:MAG: MurR/RpiR family transcriptional regulator [Anaerolineae bacterium]|nr:MurR/RpiR family transcriptional regulator [Anaerolineae bacterium]